MTTFSVPNTSNRACPSSLAGTTCRRDRSRISPFAHRSTIRCRTDRSGRFHRCVTYLRFPCLSATVHTYGRLSRRPPTPPQLATGACSNFPTEPFPGLPVGDKGHSPYLPCQPPTAPKMAFCCRTGEIGDHPILDLFDDLDAVTCQDFSQSGSLCAPGQWLKGGCPIV